MVRGGRRLREGNQKDGWEELKVVRSIGGEEEVKVYRGG